MANIYDMADSWTDSGTTYTAIKMDVTDTASAAASLLMDLQVGGSSKFKVDKLGNMGAGGGLTGAPSISFAGDPDTGLWNSTANRIAISIGGTAKVEMASSVMKLASDFALSWGSASAANGGTTDTYIHREAAATLGVRSATLSNALRVYHTYTDASNYQRGVIKNAAGYIEFAAETAGTGADDLDVLLTPAGTGAVRFGTHAAVGAETITGYITIKDAAGNARKLAVVS
jgi:hypothetical protein